jgi:hypothetical protein
MPANTYFSKYTQEPLKGCDSPWLDVSMRVLIRVEDILSIC